MYEIFTYIWLECMANVGKYCIHGACGYQYTWVLLDCPNPHLQEANVAIRHSGRCLKNSLTCANWKRVEMAVR